MAEHDPDAMILELAARQHGAVSRAQLAGAGMSVGAIDHRLKKRALRPIHRGVYCTGPIAGRYQREIAVLLACGPEAVISDRTAAGILGMIPEPGREAPVDVAGPRSLRGPASGVRLHRRGPLESDEVTERHGVLLTGPSRTILDLASCLGPWELERVLAGALRRKLVHPDSIAAMLARHSRRRGCRILGALVRDAAGPDLTRSEAETRFLALLRKAGVPRPRVNAVVGGLEVDFFWPDRHIVVEIDGFAYHAHRSAFENDRRRGAVLAANGVTEIRFTWRQIHGEPDRVLVQLCMALGSRVRTDLPGNAEPTPRP